MQFLESEKIDEKRVVYFDYLRVFATLAIVIIHVVSCKWYSADVNGTDWRMLNIYDSLARWGVPVFIMISGALFLKRDEISVKTIYSKYVFRMFTVFCFWSFIYYLFDGVSVFEQFKDLFEDGKTERWVQVINSHYHLWFVPMMAGIYICIPILKQLVRNRQVVKYFLIVSFLFWLFLPQIFSMIGDLSDNGKLVLITTALKEAFDKTQLSLVMNFSFYFVLGYFISNISFSKSSRVVIYILGLLGGIFTITFDRLIALKIQQPFEGYYGYSRVNVLMETVAIFVLFRNISFNNSRLNSIVEKISKWSFGAYCVHVLVIDNFKIYYNDMIDMFGLNVSIPLFSLIVFTISICISGFIHCVPILKKYIV